MVGNKIAKYRRLRGLTQSQLAAALNVTQSAVSQWETNKTLPDIPQLFSIAQYFGVSIEELQEIGTPKPKEQTNPDDAEIRALARNGKQLTPEQIKKRHALLSMLMEMDDDDLDRAKQVIEIYRKK